MCHQPYVRYRSVVVAVSAGLLSSSLGQPQYTSSQLSTITFKVFYGDERLSRHKMTNLNAEDTAKHLRASTSGFDALFSNDLAKARQIFGTNESPFHLLGAGICSFLEAALGMEVCACFIVIGRLGARTD